jgi:uncharacterized OB-fold protein
MTELQIQRCHACGAHWFPERLRCPTCGGGLEAVAAGAATVEAETTLRRQHDTRLGSVRLDAGPVVIARLDDIVSTGDRVRLDSNGAIWARHR